MKYQVYRPKELFLCSLIATEKSQIISTLEHYIEKGDKLSIPADNQIYEIESFNVNFTLPILSSRFSLTAEILPGVKLNTNANSVWMIQELAKNYKSLKRGSLYKFTSGVSCDGLYFLPEDVVISMRNYDWTKHWDLLNEWEHVLEGLKDPII